MPVANPAVRRRRRLRVLIGGFGLLLLLAVATLHLIVWPRLPPLPKRVDAIVELGGSAVAGRDQLAIRLAREGRARYLVQSTVPADTHHGTCLPGAPGVTVLCFHAEPATTRGEAQAIRRLAARYHWRSLVLVTTPDQAWRARLRVSRCFAGPVYVATSHLPLRDWLTQIPYQWAASAKALLWQRSC
jgi:uncharacterized SAM-binding protein YcdF (DUF218 family)